MYCNKFQWSSIGNVKFPLGVDFKAGSITIGRTLTGTWTGPEDNPQIYTACLPYGLDLSKSNFKAYTLKELSEDNKTVRFTEVTDSLEPAKPYLLVATGNGNLDNENGGMIYGKDIEDATANGVTYHGTYDRLENDSLATMGAYILQSDGLWHPVVKGYNAYLPPFRCYLTMTGAGAKALAMSLNGDDGTTTNISQIATIDRDGTTKYYDLNGRYIGTSLDRAPRGLYISNQGEKVKK